MPWAMPVDQRLDEALSLTWTTPPLEENLEVTGNPVAVLHVSSSAETAYFHVKLTDVAPDGTSKWLTDGGLLGTHRNSHSSPEPMEPGEVYELRIDMKYVSYLFEKGHRIRVSVASADFQNAWPTPLPAVNSVYCGRDCPSRAVLPLTPARAPSLPEPQFEPSPHSPATMDDLPPNRHEITHDHVAGTVTATLERDGTGGAVPGRAWSTYTVSPKNPAETVLKAGYVYEPPHPHKRIVVEAKEELRSDAECYCFDDRGGSDRRRRPLFRQELERHRAEGAGLRRRGCCRTAKSWRFRGSGPGQRGKPIHFRRALLEAVVRKDERRSGEMSLQEPPRYTREYKPSEPGQSPVSHAEPSAGAPA